MKSFLMVLATSVAIGVPAVEAQTVVPRETRVGRSRTVELVPVEKAPAPAAKAKVEQRQADQKDKVPEGKLRDAVNDKLAEIETAIRGLNPSYAIAPVIGAHAASAGSFYIRLPAGADDAAKTTALAELPRPHFVGRACRSSHMRIWPAPLWPASDWPSWLYTGTIQVEGEAPRRAVAR